MLGLIHTQLKDFVVSQFGEAKWAEVLQAAGLSAAPEPESSCPLAGGDEAFYRSLAAAPSVLGLGTRELLLRYGSHFIKAVAAEGYDRVRCQLPVHAHTAVVC